MCTCYDMISTIACAFEDNIEVTTKLSVQVVEKKGYLQAPMPVRHVSAPPWKRELEKTDNLKRFLRLNKYFIQHHKYAETAYISDICRKKHYRFSVSFLCGCRTLDQKHKTIFGHI